MVRLIIALFSAVCDTEKERSKVPHLPRRDNTSSAQEQEGVAEHPISSTCQHHLVVHPHQIRNETDPAIAMIHRLLTRCPRRVPCTSAISRTGYSRSYAIARHVYSQTPDRPVKHDVEHLPVRLGFSNCREYCLIPFSIPNERPRKIGSLT